MVVLVTVKFPSRLRLVFFCYGVEDLCIQQCLWVRLCRLVVSTASFFCPRCGSAMQRQLPRQSRTVVSGDWLWYIRAAGIGLGGYYVIHLLYDTSKHSTRVSTIPCFVRLIYVGTYQ